MKVFTSPFGFFMMHMLSRMYWLRPLEDCVADCVADSVKYLLVFLHNDMN